VVCAQSIRIDLYIEVDFLCSDFYGIKSWIFLEANHLFCLIKRLLLNAF